MANELTGLMPALYEALDVVSRELTGFIPAVTRDSGIARAAVGDDVKVPVTTVEEAQDSTPGVTAPDTGDTEVEHVTAKITKSKHVPVRWNGEETLSLQNTGMFTSIEAQRFYQAMRTLVNEIEKDIWLEAYKNASIAYGTAGSTPFSVAADMTDFAGVLGLLEQNGAPTNDLQLVLGHGAIANLRGKQSGLFKVNEAGREDLLRNGMTDRIMNMAIRHSHAVGAHAKGSGADYLTNGAFDVGSRNIGVDGGTGTILGGDIVTFAGDSNQYVTSGLDGVNLALNKSGLLLPAADNTEIVVGSNYVPNVAFARSAIALATRAPALPKGGDAATDVTQIVDPVTGLAFEIAVYKQFLQTVYHVRLAWGVKAIKQEHIGLLLG
ncbi:MAG: P22 coat - protein 5 family protein [Acinetobacter sp.]|nr:P22 coat - protein 5 family protein [Acinetobacter sp.]